VTSSHADTKIRSLNDAIGILLRSYTRAINKQEDRSGALFREKTKAKDGWEDVAVPLHHPNYGKVIQNWELYGWTAFHYIHQNPVKANIVTTAESWPYSSAADFAGVRNGTLCHQQLAKELLFLR
jgi:putative transposase